MGMKIGDFFVALGIDVEKQDSVKLNDLVKGLGNLDVKAIASAAGLGILVTALHKITSQAVKTGLALSNFSTITGISAEELQQWSFAAEQAGASASDVESSVKAISLATAQIKLGQGNVAPFQMLGLDPLEQDPFKTLRALRDKLKDLDPEMTRLITSQLGVTEGMLLLLKTSDEEFDMIDKQFFLREKQIKMLMSLRKAWIVIRQEMFIFMNTVGVALAPIFKNLSLFLQDTIDLFGKLVEKLKPFQPLVIAALAIIGTLFAPVQAGILLIIFLIDDLYTSFRTGQSAFDPFFDGVIKGFDNMVAFIKSAKETLVDFYKFVEDHSPGATAKKAIGGIKGFLDRLKVPEGAFSGGLSAVAKAGSLVSSRGGDTSVKINVNGAGDPGAVGRRVHGEFEKSLRNTTYQTQRENR